jgi:hypothetical protein
MGGGKNFLVSAAGFSILGNGIFWWKAKTKRLFSQCRDFICWSKRGSIIVLEQKLKNLKIPFTNPREN